MAVAARAVTCFCWEVPGVGATNTRLSDDEGRARVVSGRLHVFFSEQYGHGLGKPPGSCVITPCIGCGDLRYRARRAQQHQWRLQQ